MLFRSKILPDSIEASIESAIVVGSQSADYTRLKSSNYGETVDLEIYGARAQTTLASGQYGNFSATSLAASIVSGLSALILSQHPDMTLDELLFELKRVIKRVDDGQLNLKKQNYKERSCKTIIKKSQLRNLQKNLYLKNLNHTTMNSILTVNTRITCLQF